MNHFVDASSFMTNMREAGICDAGALERIGALLKSMPSQSVSERRSGRWKRSSAFAVLVKNSTDSVSCPFCGAHINERIGEVWHFCPRCGAEMDN